MTLRAFQKAVLFAHEYLAHFAEVRNLHLNRSTLLSQQACSLGAIDAVRSHSAQNIPYLLE
jgi:hypothetical protein